MPLNDLIHEYHEAQTWPLLAARERRLAELREAIDAAWENYWDEFAEAA
jgi:hypothetical protein